MYKSQKEFKAQLMQVGILFALSIILLLLVSYFANQSTEQVEPIPKWEAAFNFSTPTPTKILGEESGWWNDAEEGKPDRIPTMPGIDLYATSTPVPPPATQTVLALSPTHTSIRTPLFKGGTTITPTGEE